MWKGSSKGVLRVVSKAYTSKSTSIICGLCRGRFHPYNISMHLEFHCKGAGATETKELGQDLTSVTVDHLTRFVCLHCNCEVGSLEISEHLWACDAAINARGDDDSDTEEGSGGNFDDVVQLNM